MRGGMVTVAREGSGRKGLEKWKGLKKGMKGLGEERNVLKRFILDFSVVI